MSRRLGDRLPAALFERLRGRDLASVASDAVVLCTVDARGFPHAALLSYFEVLAIDSATLRLATYGDSMTTANMRRGRRLTLIVVFDGVAYYVKGTVEEIAPAMRETPYNAKFDVRIVDVLADEPNPALEPGAYLASGVTYVNPRRAAQLETARRVLAELQE